jgi:hypothetical protein
LFDLYISDYSSARTSFAEKKTRRLEGSTPEFFRSLMFTAWDNRKGRRRERMEAAAREKRKARRNLERRILEAEFAKREELLSKSADWTQANQIRQFLLALEANQQGDLDQNWLAWARAYTDGLDPILSGYPSPRVQTGPFINESTAFLEAVFNRLPDTFY